MPEIALLLTIPLVFLAFYLAMVRLHSRLAGACSREVRQADVLASHRCSVFCGTYAFLPLGLGLVEILPSATIRLRGRGALRHVMCVSVQMSELRSIVVTRSWGIRCIRIEASGRSTLATYEISDSKGAVEEMLRRHWVSEERLGP